MFELLPDRILGFLIGMSRYSPTPLTEEYITSAFVGQEVDDLAVTFALGQLINDKKIVKVAGGFVINHNLYQKVKGV